VPPDNDPAHLETLDDPQASPGALAEVELVARLKAGDDAAYEHLVRTLTGRMLAVARRLTRSEADAEDVVQEAFLSAFKAMQSFDGRASLSTWLHRIVVNAALMRARKHKSRKESSIDELLPQFEDGLHKSQPTKWRKGVTSSPIESIEQRKALFEALDKLPDEFRSVIILKDIEGLESKAIAASLGITDALARQRLHRARLALMKLLEPAMAEENRP
jgi:RNA polymerase sigma-70 factor, ECF subfamily